MKLTMLPNRISVNMQTKHLWFVENIFLILHFCIVLIFLAHILRQRKSPAATIAWFLFALISPYIGIPFYFLFGSRKFLSTKPALFFDDNVPTVKLSDPIQKILISGGCPAPCFNREVRLLKSGEEAFRELVFLIANAEKSIYLETYIFSGDKVGKLILKELENSARRGVDVRLLIDAFGAYVPGGPSFKNFKLAGGRVEFFMPFLHRPFRGANNLRNHRKQLIIDQESVILGGMNIAKEYMGPKQDLLRWTDLSILIKGQIASQFGAVFLSDWAYATEEVAQKSSIVISNDFAESHRTQLVVSGPDVKTDPIYEMLLTAIYGARYRIWIATPYFVPDEALVKAMELAVRRGVDVRIIIPRKSDQLLADLARSTYVQRIQDFGGHIFLFKKMLHAKTTLIDDSCALLGSANTDGRSLFLNYELGVSLYSAQDLKEIESWFMSVFEGLIAGVAPPSWFRTLAGDLTRLLEPLI
jgi:cardiolipin synthase